MKRRALIANSAIRPLMESLEPRLMLSGNVTLLVAAGNLTITGDTASNNIAISQSATGAYTVTGLSGTNVIFGASTADHQAVTGVIGNITINFVQGGDDNVALTSDLHVGNVDLTTLVGKRGNVTYTGGVGDDNVTFGGTWATGTIAFTSNPADGDTLTLADPDGKEVTFEFDSGGGVTGDNTAVPIGASASDTLQNFLGAEMDTDLMLNLDDISLVSPSPTVRVMAPPGSAGNGLLSAVSTHLTIVNTTGGQDFVFDCANLSVALGGSAAPNDFGGNLFSVGSISTVPSLDDMSEIHGTLAVTGGVAVTVAPITQDLCFIASTIVFSTASFNFSAGVTDANVIIYASGDDSIGCLGGSLTYTGGAGDDFLELDTSVFGNVTATFGAGYAELEATDANIAGNVTVSATGVDDDTVTLSGADVNGNVSVTFAAGNDQVNLDDATVIGVTTLNLGAGNNIVDLSGSTFATNVSVIATTGNDQVHLSGGIAVYGNLTLNLGAGGNLVSNMDGVGHPDEVYIKGTVSILNSGTSAADIYLTGQMGSTTVTLGSGTNNLSIDDARINGSLTLTSTTGADLFNLADSDTVVVAGLVKITTGNGDDQIFVGADGGDLHIGSTLSITTGNGEDTVDFGDTWEVGGSFTLVMGTAPVGGNAITLDSGRVGGSASITTGAASDTVHLNSMVVVGNLTLTTGAGDDDVSFPNLIVYGSLTANLGDGDNSASVQDTDATVGGKVTITATGTGGSLVELAGQMGAVTVTLGGGDDYITIDDNQINGALTLTTGAGADIINIAENHTVVVTGLAKITTGNGDDLIFIGSDGGGRITVGSTLTIATGIGDDDVDIRNNWTVASTFSLVMGNAPLAGNTVDLYDGRIGGSASISTGTASDSITLDNMFVIGNLTVNAGAGADLLSLPDLVVYGSLTATLGDGDNIVSVRNSDSDLTEAYVGGKVTITSIGLGTSDIELAGELGALTISLGSGDNYVSIDHADIYGDVSITTGSGSDTLELAANNVGLSVNRLDVSGLVRLTTGNGDDTIRLGSDSGHGTVTVAKSLTITAGNGGDSIELAHDWTVRGSLVLTAGTTATSNVISLIGGSIYGSAAVTTGNGFDSLTITDVMVNLATTIKTGAGDDLININGDSNLCLGGGAFSLLAGDGADTVNVANMTGRDFPTTFFRAATFDMGNGDDLLRIGLSPDGTGDANTYGWFGDITGGLKVIGGAGNDTLYYKFQNGAGDQPIHNRLRLAVVPVTFEIGDVA